MNEDTTGPHLIRFYFNPLSDFSKDTIRKEILDVFGPNFIYCMIDDILVIRIEGTIHDAKKIKSEVSSILEKNKIEFKDMVEMKELWLVELFYDDIPMDTSLNLYSSIINDIMKNDYNKIYTNFYVNISHCVLMVDGTYDDALDICVKIRNVFSSHNILVRTTRADAVIF